MKTQAIVPMAGMGTRLKSDLPKPLVLLNGQPIFVHTLEVLHKSDIDSIILVVHQEYLKEYEQIAQQHKFEKIAKIVPGGKTRRESVCKGLKELDVDTQRVLIHDGVRPLITQELLKEIIVLSNDHEAVVTAVVAKPTMKRVDVKNMMVVETLNRETVWEAQTPQVFHKDIILKAHQEFKGEPTDDAMMVEALGCKVKVLKGSYDNIKITTQEDLTLVQQLASV